MKKTLFIILILIISITGCERDDICIDEITPNMVVKFFDNQDNTIAKSVSNLSAKIINGSQIDSISLLVNDTIASIPLKVTEDITQYILTINSGNVSESIRDTITLSYIREEVFVGRSCGFKTVFKDVIISNTTNNWIQNIETLDSPQNIENEIDTHVKIFH